MRRCSWVGPSSASGPGQRHRRRRRAVGGGQCPRGDPVQHRVCLLFLALIKERAELLHAHAAATDELTGIANRRAFLEAAGAAAEAARPRGRQRRRVRARSRPLQDDQRPLRPCRRRSRAGDVRRHRRGGAPAGDLLGRFGGEEFAALLPEVDAATALACAERIRCAFADAAPSIDGRVVAASVSIGVAVEARTTTPLVELLGRADRALYRAKALGRIAPSWWSCCRRPGRRRRPPRARATAA